MGGKIFGFPWKNFATCKLKRVGKKCAKEGAKKIFNSSNFLKKSDQQKSRIFSSKAVFFFDTPPSTPPPPPSSFLSSYLCELGFFGVELELSHCGYQHRPRAECADKPCILS
jgi:hypothetical protein